MIEIKYLENEHASTIIVEPSKEGDACIDIKATDVVWDPENNVIVYSTGMFVEIPKGYEMEIRPRSSITKYDLMLQNSPGTIDSGYRGEILLKYKVIANPNRETKIYEKGDKIAQFKINELIEIAMSKVEKLSPSERDIYGFGHTGV